MHERRSQEAHNQLQQIKQCKYSTNGGNINVQDENGETALIKAAIKGNQDAKLIRLLLENGADPYIEDNKGRNAISVAKTPIIKKIIKRLSTDTTRK